MLSRLKLIASLVALAGMLSNTAVAACVTTTTTVVTRDGSTTTTTTTEPAGQSGSQSSGNGNGKPGGWSIFGNANGGDGAETHQTTNTECKN